MKIMALGNVGSYNGSFRFPIGRSLQLGQPAMYQSGLSQHWHVPDNARYQPLDLRRSQNYPMQPGDIYRALEQWPRGHAAPHQVQLLPQRMQFQHWKNARGGGDVDCRAQVVAPVRAARQSGTFIRTIAEDVHPIHATPAAVYARQFFPRLPKAVDKIDVAAQIMSTGVPRHGQSYPAQALQQYADQMAMRAQANVGHKVVRRARAMSEASVTARYAGQVMSVHTPVAVPPVPLHYNAQRGMVDQAVAWRKRR